MAEIDCQIAEAAQELIRDPEHFTRGAYARDANGDVVAIHSEHAVKFCVVGALMRVMGINGYSRRVEAALNQAAREYAGHAFNHYPDSINDQHGHKAVMTLYDRVKELVC